MRLTVIFKKIPFIYFIFFKIMSTLQFLLPIKDINYLVKYVHCISAEG